MSLLEKDKRKFSVIIGSKKCGACSGASPSGAAKKVKGKSGAFYLKETTKDSKKKLYGPYSSKKKVVQRGGEENSLREQICNTVLEILRNCDKLRPVDQEMNVKYGILENAYLSLEIDHRKDKCDVLNSIIRRRDIYITRLGQEFTLCHCLCSSFDIQNPIEIGFCSKNGLYCKNKTRTDGHFYDKNWSKLISFLRRIIRQIEYDTLLNVKETSQKLTGIRRELNNNLNMMPRSNKPPPAYLLTNEEFAEIGLRPNGSSLTSTNNLIARLEAIKNKNKNQNTTQTSALTSTNNLIAKLAALRND